MKESETKNNIQNSINSVVINEYKHNIKESTVHFEEEANNNQNIKKENENGTVTTTMGFLKEGELQNDPLSNLNKSLPKTDDTSNNSLTVNSKDDKMSAPTVNESFYQKTKRWAGTAWSYINIKNYFPKTQYKEYRNINGDIVKVPIKKIPLKKKPKVELTDEQYIVNKIVDKNNNQLNFYAADNVPYYSNFI